MALHLTDEYKTKVYEDLRQGSNPRAAFFLMVALSTLIATFGLVMNSTAVVIGAMLVAPLMTPILGLALGLVRGQARFIGIALRSETAGVVLAIAVAAVFGMILPYFEATPEMLSRTRPNLLDLLVAVFAGLAGAYALVDKRLSPALPGVAISTAIVPPLANTGLSLSLGAYAGAWGSFLLFFTNFLSILLVSAFVFSIAGMGGKLRFQSGLKIARRLSVALVGFGLVSILLGTELLKMLEHQRLGDDIRNVLEAELYDLRVRDLEKIVHKTDGDNLLVLAEVNASRVISPQKVSLIETLVAERVERPVRLNIRTTVTKDVSATGHFNPEFTETLDGFDRPDDAKQSLQTVPLAEQVIREYLGDTTGVYLEEIRGFPFGEKQGLAAEISGTRWLTRDEMTELETLVQETLLPVPVSLKFVQRLAYVRDKGGGMRTQFEIPRSLTDDEQSISDRIEVLANDWLSEGGFWLDGWSMNILDGSYHVLLEVKGARLFSSADFRKLKKELVDEVGVPLELFVRSVPEAVVGEDGAVAFEPLLRDYGKRNRDAYADEIRQLIREVR